MAPDLQCSSAHGGHVGAPVGTGRSADTDEHHAGSVEALGDAGREPQTSGPERLGEQLAETGFVERRVGAGEQLALGGIGLDGDDVAPERGEASGDDGADVAAPDHRDRRRPHGPHGEAAHAGHDATAAAGAAFARPCARALPGRTSIGICT